MTYDADKQFHTLFEKMKVELKLTSANKRILEDHVGWLRAKASNPRTVLKHLYCMNKFLQVLGKNGDLSKLDKKEMEKAIGKLNATNLSDETKRDIKAVLKQFYKHLLGDDEVYPRVISWIKTGNRKTSKRLPEILNEDEVLSMIKVMHNIRDKAIIALLYDSGIRNGELLNLKIKDIDLNSKPNHIIVDGKTGMRQIPILFSVPYIANYLNTISDVDERKPFLRAVGSWTELDRTIDHNAVTKVLKSAARKAGIKKRVYPHLFRHSRASHYANKLTEQQLKAFFGWTGDSRMASTYVHLSGRDIDNAVMLANGKESVMAETKSKLTTRECPRCKFEMNAMDSAFCARCGSALDIATAINQDETEKSAKEALTESLREKEFSERLEKHIVEKKKKSAK